MVDLLNVREICHKSRLSHFYILKNFCIILETHLFKVPGLAENRPSVLKGDHLFVKLKGENEDVEYKGYVHAVECEKVHLGFGHKYG